MDQRFVWSALGYLCLIAPVFAQVPQTILAERELLPGSNNLVVSISGVSTNSLGGYSVSGQLRDAQDLSSSDIGFAYGVVNPNLGSTPSALLVLEGGVPLWSGGIGMDDLGQLGFIGNTFGQSGVVEEFGPYFKGEFFATIGDPLPAPFSGSFSDSRRVGIADDGSVYLFSLVDPDAMDTQTSGWGLFRKAPGATRSSPWTALLKPGEQIPNMPVPLYKCANVDWGFANDHYIAIVRRGPCFPDAPAMVVRDGVGLVIEESVLLSGTEVPASFGMPGALWERFSAPSINTGGEYVLGASIRLPDNSAPLERVLIVNGALALRAGQSLDGGFLFGAVELTSINELGKCAFSWGGQVYYESVRMMGISDPVDLDGDGQLDGPSQVVSVLELALGNLDDLYVRFDVVDPTINLFPFTAVNQFDVRILQPTAYCAAKASSAGCLASMKATIPEAPASGAGDTVVDCTSTQAERPGLFFWGVSGRAELPFLNGGTLCVNPPLGRTPIQFSGGSVSGGCSGSYQLLVNAPGAAYDLGPGSQSWFQVWVRDTTVADPGGTALSDGLEVSYQ